MTTRSIASQARAVTVVVPVYNRLELLQRTVASLRTQTLPEVEFLLVDDHSEQPTRDFLGSLSAADQRFCVLLKPEGLPRGTQTSKNIGLDAARGNSVLFLDSDDILTPDCLERRYAYLATHTDDDFVIGRQAILQENSSTHVWVNIPSRGHADLDRFLALANPIDVPWVNAGILIRTDSLQRARVRWRPEFHWDDVVFHLELLWSGLKGSWLGSDGPPDMLYRQHGGEHYGRVLHTAEGLANSSEMFLWICRQLKQKGHWSELRRPRLSRSWFHACLLPAIDQRLTLARVMLSQARAEQLLTRAEFRALRAYHFGRESLRRSARVTFYWNRLAAKTWLDRFMSPQRSSYGTVPVPARFRMEQEFTK